MLEEWNAKAVRQTLARAFRVLDATTDRVGQKRVKAAMPEYEYSAADLNEQYLAEVDAQKTGETTMRSQLVAKFRPSSEEISRCYAVLLGTKDSRAWLKMVDAYPDHRATLITGVLAAARGWSDRRLCREKGWTLSTYQRHRDFAADVIATQLNRLGIKPWR